MMPVSRLALPALLTVLTAGSHAAAQTDVYGDPLPKGAIARLGTARFRHAGLSSHVVLSDDRTVVTAGGDRIVRTWDLASGTPKKIVPLQGKGGPGQLYTLTPDGKTVAARIANQLVLWDADSGKEIKRVQTPKGVNPAFLRVAPDGKTLAVVTVGRGVGGGVSLIDVATGTTRAIAFATTGVKVRPRAPNACATFSPDGNWFVCGALQTDELCIVETASGRIEHRIAAAVLGIAVSPDSKRLATCLRWVDNGKRKTTLRMFDLASGKQTAEFPLGAAEWYSALAFSPDGKTLACGEQGRRYTNLACLLDASTGKLLYRLQGCLLAPGFSHDGKTLIGSTGQRLRTWDVASGKERGERPGDLGRNPALAVSSDGRLLVSCAFNEPTMAVWDTTTGRLLRSLPLRGGADVAGVAFAADGKAVVACDMGGLLQSWDAATGKQQRDVELAADNPGQEVGALFHLHLAPDGKHVSAVRELYGVDDSVMRVGRWNTATGKPAGAGYHVYGEDLPHIVWLADGTRAVLNQPGAMTLVDVASGAVAMSFQSAARDKLVITPDDRLLAGKKRLAGKPDPRAVIWEMVTGKEVATVTTEGFGQMALTPDNRCLVTTEYGVVIVRDMATGTVRLRWPLPEAELRTPNRTYFHALLLSPDGRRAFTVLADGTALVWDLTPALRNRTPLVKSPAPQELAAWWTDLGSNDAAKARRAIWSLVDAPKEAVPFLRERLKPVVPPDGKQVQRWIADLDSDEFATRQAAQRELDRIADRIESIVRQALKSGVPIETRRRLQTLLKSQHGIPSADEVGTMRAVEALELIGSADARVLLRALAAGAPGARLTREAQAALERLGRRAPLAG